MATEKEFFDEDQDSEEENEEEGHLSEPEDDNLSENDDDQLPLPLEEEASEPEEEDAEPESDAYKADNEKLTRGEKRFQTLANRTREAQEKADRLERELAEIRRGASTRLNEVSERQRYQQWYQTLSPAEQFMENARRTAEESSVQVQNLQRTVLDNSDRAEFTLYLSNRPEYQKYRNEVERKLGEIRSTGVDAKRRAILTYILGEAVERSSTKPVSKKVAASNVKGQTTRVVRTGSSVAKDRREKAGDMSLEALENRLRGKSLSSLLGGD